jgi:hypothetical protein
LDLSHRQPMAGRPSFPDTAAGIVERAAFCDQGQAGLMTMEAAGGCEQQPFLLLAGHGLRVAILKPRRCAPSPRAVPCRCDGNRLSGCAQSGQAVAWAERMEATPQGR